jgi:hypothetical protein
MARFLALQAMPRLDRHVVDESPRELLLSRAERDRGSISILQPSTIASHVAIPVQSQAIKRACHICPMSMPKCSLVSAV